MRWRSSARWLRASVAPPVGRHLGVLVLRVGGAEGQQLGALGPCLQAAHHLARNPQRVPLAQLDDLVVELDARAAADHDVDLFLLAVPVPERDPETRRDLEVAE